MADSIGDWIQAERDTPLCIAHRGASDYAHDNAIEAFERAALLGADLFEVDVRCTADGVLVAWHDPSTRQLGGEPRPVSSLTLNELQAIAGRGGRRIARFDDVLALASQRGIGIYVDAKDAAAVSGAGEQMTAHGIERGVIASYNTASLRALRDRGSRHALSVLVPRSGDPLKLADKAGASIVHLCWAGAPPPVQERLSAELLETICQAGLATVLWHQEDPAIIETWRQLPVLGICSNQPELLRSFRHEEAAWKPRIMCTGGARHIAPENTAPALTCGFNAGYDYARLEIALSADGIPVICSDTRIARLSERMSGTRCRVADLPLATLCRLDAGATFDAYFSGTPLLTLADAVVLADRHRRSLALEVANRSLATVLAVLADHGRVSDHFFWSHDPLCLRRLRQESADACIISRRRDHGSLGDTIGSASADWIEFDAHCSDQAEIRDCQRRGLSVLLVCRDEMQGLSQAVDARVDIIETDRLDMLRTLLDDDR